MCSALYVFYPHLVNDLLPNGDDVGVLLPQHHKPLQPVHFAGQPVQKVFIKGKHRISVQLVKLLHPLPLNPGLETFLAFVIRARISHCQIWKSRRCQIWIAFHVFRFNWLAAENAASKARNFSSAPFRQNRLFHTFLPHWLKQFWTSLTLSSLGAYCNYL